MVAVSQAMVTSVNHSKELPEPNEMLSSASASAMMRSAALSSSCGGLLRSSEWSLYMSSLSNKTFASFPGIFVVGAGCGGVKEGQLPTLIMSRRELCPSSSTKMTPNISTETVVGCIADAALSIPRPAPEAKLGIAIMITLLFPAMFTFPTYSGKPKFKQPHGFVSP